MSLPESPEQLFALLLRFSIRSAETANLYRYGAAEYQILTNLYKSAGI